MEDGLPETVNSLEAVRHLLATNKKELPTNFELTEGLISPTITLLKFSNFFTNDLPTV